MLASVSLNQFLIEMPGSSFMSSDILYDYFFRIRDMNRNRGITSLETENQRIAKKIKNAKGVYSIKKWVRNFKFCFINLNLLITG